MVAHKFTVKDIRRVLMDYYDLLTMMSAEPLEINEQAKASLQHKIQEVDDLLHILGDQIDAIFPPTDDDASNGADNNGH